MLESLPRLLRDFQPAAGVIKADYEDFVVEEIPLYPADGQGSHTYFLLEKVGLSTAQATHDIARALNVRRHEIGFAGQKDARAVTRQWMSVEHIDPAIVKALVLPRLTVLDATRHHNKLRLGHLKGNRFVIKIRQTEPDRLPELQVALDELVRRGVPNYFGPQRFGYRGDTWQIGRALLRGDLDEALNHMLGCPTAADVGDIRRARERFDCGDYATAARAWPRMFHTERRVLQALAHSQGNRRRGLGAVERTTRYFYASAYQSLLFNRVVAARLEYGLDHLLPGDLAWLHTSGAVFRVDDAAHEQPRADCFEVSPSGPLFGYRMTEPTGRPADIEAAVLAVEELSPHLFRGGPLRIKGSRRPLRFPVHDAVIRLGADQRGAYLDLRFLLLRGCYATVLLRELFGEAGEAAGFAEWNATEDSAGPDIQA